MASLDLMNYVSTAGPGLSIQTRRIINLVAGSVVGAFFSAQIAIILGFGEAVARVLEFFPWLFGTIISTVGRGILGIVTAAAGASARGTTEFEILAFAVGVVVVGATVYGLAWGVSVLVEP